MRDRYGRIIKEGHTITACYAVPPTEVKALVVKVKGRLWCRVMRHQPRSMYLTDFVKTLKDVEVDDA